MQTTIYKKLTIDQIEELFDTSFNALLLKGHIKHFETQSNQNTFITTLKH